MVQQKSFGTNFCSFGLHWDRYGALMVPQRSFGFHFGSFGLHYYCIHGFLVFLGTLWYSYGTTKALMVPLWYPYGILMVPLWYPPMAPLFSHFFAFFGFVALLAPLWHPYGTPPMVLLFSHFSVFFRLFALMVPLWYLMVPLWYPYGTSKTTFFKLFCWPRAPVFIRVLRLFFRFSLQMTYSNHVFW